MPKIRSIHPDVCESDKLLDLSDGAERTLWRLATHADDDGRGVDNPKLISNKLYPLDDTKTAEEIDSHLDELVKAGMLVRYQVGGKRYYEIHDFTDWQKPKYRSESKIPSPDQSDPAPSPDQDQTEGTPGEHLPDGDGGVSGDGGGEGDLAPAKPPHNEIFETLIEVCGWDLKALTDSARGRTNKATKELRKIGASPEGIRARAELHRHRWPDMSLTPNSIAANYAELGKSSAPPTAADSAAVREYDPADAEARFAALTGDGIDDRKTA